MKINILHVVPLNNKNSMPIFVKNQIEDLKKLDLNCEILPIKTSKLLNNIKYLYSKFIEIRQIIKKKDIKLVHCHWGSILSLFTGISAIKFCPVVITFRGSDINPVPSEFILFSKLRGIFSQISVLFSTGVICVSDQLSKKIFIKPKFLKTILDGTNLKNFYPKNKTKLKKKLKWNLKKKIILFYKGNEPKVKRLDLAKLVANELKKKNPHSRLKVISRGFSQKKISDLINASDCLIMLSDYEGSPNIVREALSCNTPVVSFDVGDVKKWKKFYPELKIVDRNIKNVVTFVIKSFSLKKNLKINPSNIFFSSKTSAIKIFLFYNKILRSKFI